MRDIALHVLDIMQNSTAANAGLIQVILKAYQSKGMLEIEIKDNGCGMDSELLSKVTDPFTTTRNTRKVGLGIPLLKEKAEQSGGSFEIRSQSGMGTTVTARFPVDSIDRPPLGDLAGVMADMTAACQKVEFQLQLKFGSKKFIFSSREVSKVLGSVSISEFSVVNWMREYIQEGLNEIFGGVLVEIDS